MTKPNETEPTTDQTETPAEPAPAPAAVEVAAPEVKTFTQEELDAIVAKRVAKAERAAEKRARESQQVATKPNTQPEQTPKAPAASEPQSNSDIAALRAEFAKERNDRLFAEALSELGVKLNKTQRDLLRGKFDPDDPDSLEEIAKDAGWLKPAPNPTAATQPQAAPTNGGPAHVQTQRESTFREPPGAPNGNPETARGSDLMSWSRDDVQRARENGTFLQEVERFRNSLPGGNPTGLFQKRNKALGK